MNADGKAYTADGYVQDVSDLGFFRQGMAGEPTLTDGIGDKAEQGKQYVSLLAVPVYNEEQTEVVGVFYATCAEEWIEELLDTESFEGRGYSCLVRKDGEVIAHSLGSPYLMRLISSTV